MTNEHEQHAAQEVAKTVKAIISMAKEKDLPVKEVEREGVSVNYGMFKGTQEYNLRTLAKMGLISAATGVPMTVKFNERHSVIQPEVELENHPSLPKIGEIFRRVNEDLKQFAAKQGNLEAEHVFWRLPTAPGLNASAEEREAFAVLENIYATGGFYARTFTRDHFIYLFLSNSIEYLVTGDRTCIDVAEDNYIQFTKSLNRIVSLVAQQ